MIEYSIGALDAKVGFLPHLIGELLQGHKRAHFQLKFGLLYGDDIDTRVVGDALQLAGIPRTRDNVYRGGGDSVGSCVQMPNAHDQGPKDGVTVAFKISAAKE